MAASSAETLQEYECPICKEFFDVPCVLKCNHTFCLECIIKHFNVNPRQNQQKCPVCQQTVNVYLKRPAEQVVERMQQLWTQCADCNVRVTLADYKKHKSRCNAASPGSPASLSSPGAFPTHEPRCLFTNRYTFDCPYCTKVHMDRETLLSHCASAHAGDGNHRRVCPICAAMPWGDKAQISGHLLQHMQLRHKFDYEYFVDFNTTDEEQLRRALDYSGQW